MRAKVAPPLRSLDGDTIIALRERAGLLALELAAALGVSRTLLYLLESDRKDVHRNSTSEVLVWLDGLDERRLEAVARGIRAHVKNGHPTLAQAWLYSEYLLACEPPARRAIR